MVSFRYVSYVPHVFSECFPLLMIGCPADCRSNPVVVTVVYCSRETDADEESSTLSWKDSKVVRRALKQKVDTQETVHQVLQSRTDSKRRDEDFCR